MSSDLTHQPPDADSDRLTDAINTARSLVVVARKAAEQARLAHREAELALERAVAVARMLVEMQERAHGRPPESPEPPAT